MNNENKDDLEHRLPNLSKHDHGRDHQSSLHEDSKQRNNSMHPSRAPPQNNFENAEALKNNMNPDEYLEKQIKHYTLEQGKLAQ